MKVLKKATLKVFVLAAAEKVHFVPGKVRHIDRNSDRNIERNIERIIESVFCVCKGARPCANEAGEKYPGGCQSPFHCEAAVCFSGQF